MVLGGLWHGASWTFVLWGAFHGAVLIVYRVLGVDDWIARRRGPAILRRLQDAALIGLMFVLVCFGWLLFRAPDLATVGVFVRGMLGAAGAGITQTDDWLGPFRSIIFYVVPLLAFQALQLYKRNLLPLGQLPAFAQLNIQMFVLYSLFFLASATSQKFIYFNF
jgi:hypothetical protein